jgi:hypothetical protein
MEGAIMQDELDKNLHSLFQEKRNSLTEEPFLGNMLKLIERKRAWRVFAQRAFLGMGIIIVALLAPYLVKGSALLSVRLNALFEIAGGFMASPRGIACAACCALLIYIFKRRWVSTFI